MFSLWGQGFGPVWMALRATSNRENAASTASVFFNHLRRVFNGAAGLPAGPELYASR